MTCRDQKLVQSGNILTEIDPELIIEGLADGVLREKAQKSISLIGGGFSSFVYQLGNDVILRVAKHSDATHRQQKEMALLPNFQNSLSFKIPNPQWYFTPSSAFKFGAVAYKKIEGRPFDLALAGQINFSSVTADIARFIAELHKIDGFKFSHKRTADQAKTWSVVSPLLSKHLNPTLFKLAGDRWQRYLFRHVQKANQTFVHGDLWAENLILNKTLDRVIGIIDFENCGLGDFVQDFVPHIYVSPHFLTEVVRQFKKQDGHVGRHFEERLVEFLFVRELVGLQYAIQYSESNELDDSLAKVSWALRTDFAHLL